MIALKEEIFGPILPIVGYHNLEEAIDFVNRRPNPLDYTGLARIGVKRIL